MRDAPPDAGSDSAGKDRRILEAVTAAMSLPPEGAGSLLREYLGDNAVAIAEAESLFDFRVREQRLEITRTMRGFSPGEVLGDRFRVVRCIGHGGMGDVYEVEDLAHAAQRRVALKTIRDEISTNARSMERFKREIAIAQTVTHPNVCRVYDLGMHVGGDEDGRPSGRAPLLFLTMELLEGETLTERLSGGQRMSPAEALPLLRQMAAALDAAHDMHVVHRDFKPGNIMLTGARGRATANDGARLGTRAVVTDFGLAVNTLVADDASESGGTPDYMAPEQVRGEAVGPAADIYALGVVAYRMITGRLPFRGNDPQVRMVRRLHEDPLPLGSDVDVRWSAAILRCLHRRPEERFASAGAFVQAVENPGVKIGVERAGYRRLFILATAIAILAVAAAIGVRAVLHRNGSPTEQKRLAVLGFDNVGGQPADAAFCDGLTYTVASRLTQLERSQQTLSVIPVADLRRYKVASARDAQREFGATLAITGSVERSTAATHIIIVLADARQLKQIRSADLYFTPDQIAKIQDSVVRRVAELLGFEPQSAASNDGAQEGFTNQPRALEYYLRGTGYLERGRVGIDLAVQEFEQALAIDSKYALAKAGLAEAYWGKFAQSHNRKWLDAAWAQSQGALELSPKLARPHVTLALLNEGTGRYENAISQARTAIGIDPGNDQAYTIMSRALKALGRPDQAEKVMRQAISIRPSYWINHLLLGQFYFERARYSEAAVEFRRVTELVPENPEGYTNLGIVYAAQGNDEEAERFLRRSLDLRKTELAASNLASVYFFEGRFSEAIPIMEDLVRSGHPNYLYWGNLGDDYRWTPGYRDKAPQAYRQAVELTDQALAVNPRDINIMSAKALYLAKMGEVGKALDADGLVIRSNPDDPDVLLDLTVVHEIAGRRDEALNFLKRAVAAGCSRHLVEVDPELSALRRDPRYTTAISFKK